MDTIPISADEWNRLLQEHSMATRRIERTLKLCEDIAMYAQAADIMGPKDRGMYEVAVKVIAALREE